MNILLEKGRSEFSNSSLFYEIEIYDEDNTYDDGDEVIYLKDGHKYTSKKDGNDDPLDDDDSWDDNGEWDKVYIYDFWENGKEYNKLDLVRSGSHGYQSLVSNNTKPLDNTEYWNDLGEDKYYHTIWDSSTSYSTDDIVIYKKDDDFYYLFQSMKDDNDSEPTTNIDWYELTTQNAYKAFDIYLNTHTTAKDSLSIWLDLTKCNYTALLSLLGEKIRIRAYSSSMEKLDDIEIDLVTNIEGWEDYFYGDLDEFLSSVFEDITYSYTGYLRVDLTGSQNPILLGKALVGYKKELGATLLGLRGSITDYSTKETDDYGNIYLKQGAYAIESSGRIMVDNNNLDYLFRKLASLRATPVLWLSGAEDTYKTLNTYGYYKDFSIIFDNNVTSTCDLTIQGII